jgi:DNA-binding MarR family transcriptional regulator
VTADAAEPQPLTPAEDAAWRALTRVIVALPRIMDADLLARAKLTLNEYLVLMFLSEAPGRALRMSELADAILISFSGLTRLIERLERDDSVRREKIEQDGRGSRAVLTDNGLARLKAAWPAHLESVRRIVMEHLGEVDLPALTHALTDMIDENAALRHKPNNRTR